MNNWHRQDLNLRQWRLQPKCSALDHSATMSNENLLHEVSILGPLGYEPNTLPLRHGADVRGSRQNIQILYLCTKQIIHNFIFALKVTGHAENDGGWQEAVDEQQRHNGRATMVHGGRQDNGRCLDIGQGRRIFTLPPPEFESQHNLFFLTTGIWEL